MIVLFDTMGAHVYEIPPDAVREMALPIQTDGDVGEMVGDGTGATSLFSVVVRGQLFPFTPVTEYTVVESGATTTAVPVEPPGFQVSEPTAVGATAVSVVLIPGQVIVGFAATVMLGPGSAVTVYTAELVHEPEPPTAVYVVVTVG